jgi:hypothetical protein
MKQTLIFVAVLWIATVLLIREDFGADRINFEHIQFWPHGALLELLIGISITSLAYVTLSYQWWKNRLIRHKNDVGHRAHYRSQLSDAKSAVFTRYEIILLPLFIVSLVLLSRIHANSNFWISFAIWLAYVNAVTFLLRTVIVSRLLEKIDNREI